MNNVEIYIVVEGQTEQTFVRDVLAPQMADKGISLHAALIGKPGHKGGVIHFDRAKNDIGNFLKQRDDTYVSTMFDYFRIDSNWPGRPEVSRKIQNGCSLTAIQKAEILEGATSDEIVMVFADHDAKNRFIPYIEMHEFEALLFSDADILAERIEIDILHIRKILEEYNNPEEINEEPAKAPAKRLEALKNGYRKVANGKTISEAIGIQTIRRQCAHFNNWLKKFEHLQGISKGEVKNKYTTPT
ncbi:MAG: DUF4276 family protein [bacterium]